MSSAVALERRSLPAFFGLVFMLAVPFWVIGADIGNQLLPGLPVSALMAFVPAIAASLLVYREDHAAGVIALLRRAFDSRSIRPAIWYLPSLLLFPGAAIVSYVVMRLLGTPLPAPQFSLATALVLFVAFFLGGVGEEAGWTGYITDPMQLRWTALPTGVLLGAVLTVWHVIPLVQAQRAPGWIAGWCVGTVAARVLFVWLYNNSGKSVFGAVLFHDMSNVSWQLFPTNGSHYDPRVSGLVLAVVAAIVTVIWGPRTLARFRTN
jgi:membrane protease YdiL (CAAX protease family)